MTSLNYISEILKCISELKRIGPEFNDDFGRWKKQRMETLSQLETLKQKIESVSTGCTTAQTAGTLVAAVGNLVDLVGICMSAAGNESAGTVMKAGSVCNALGTATAATATLAELGLSHQLLNEVNEVLVKDEKLTEFLRKWVTNSRQLNTCLTRTFSCSVTDEIFGDVIRIVDHAMCSVNRGEVVIEEILREIQNGKKEFSFANLSEYPQVVIDKFSSVMQIIQNHPEWVEPLQQICQILNESSMTYKLLVSGINISLIILKAMNTDILSLLALGGLCLPFALKNNMTRSILDTIGFAVNVISTIKSADSLTEEKSRYSKNLENLQQALKFECDKLEETIQKM